MLTTTEIAVTATIWVLTTAGLFFGIRGVLRRMEKRGSMHKAVYLALILALFSPLPLLAAPAITCHCFTERTFDPAHPVAADPYFITSAQNSFFSALFATDIHTIVMKKQGGTFSDDLWIAYWIAAKDGVLTPGATLKAKQGKTWQAAVSSIIITNSKLKTRLAP
ncbi:MAG: hypothetical protein PHY09_04135 [Desulfuromonadaceae bacterium]|nr:hypothetical protein [Desulfuromonadaceae bacterium]MDD5105768.1 hypothetical protein [Desulfuromonadaceae bacterium]